MLLTPEHLILIPRSRERYPLVPTLDSHGANTSSEREEEDKTSMSINSLGFAGMILVKSEEEVEAVIKEGIVTMLRCVAMRVPHGEAPQLMGLHSIVHLFTHRGVGVPRIADDSLAEPHSRDDAS